MRARPSILPLHLAEVCFEADGRRLVDRLTTTIEPGTSTVILGPNGAGKSLTLRLAHGLLRPSAGCVIWQGAGTPRTGRDHAMVFHKPVLLRRSVLANMTYALALHGIEHSRRAAIARDTLERFGLAHLADRPARVLSGGEQQRLALARAWATRPEVVFLDEPTSNLDPGATRQIEQMIGVMHAAGTTIVMTSHDLGQARRLADRVLFLNRGRLVEDAPAERFFAEPASPEAAAFLAGELLW